MRPIILLSLLMLPMTGCMTQRDRTVWQEFKNEFFSSKDEVKADGAAAPAVNADSPAEPEVKASVPSPAE